MKTLLAMFLLISPLMGPGGLEGQRTLLKNIYSVEPTEQHLAIFNHTSACLGWPSEDDFPRQWFIAESILFEGREPRLSAWDLEMRKAVAFLQGEWYNWDLVADTAVQYFFGLEVPPDGAWRCRFSTNSQIVMSVEAGLWTEPE